VGLRAGHLRALCDCGVSTTSSPGVNPTPSGCPPGLASLRLARGLTPGCGRGAGEVNSGLRPLPEAVRERLESQVHLLQ
jgi:hypothetical protein